MKKHGRSTQPHPISIYLLEIKILVNETRALLGRISLRIRWMEGDAAISVAISAAEPIGARIRVRSARTARPKNS